MTNKKQKPLKPLTAEDEWQLICEIGWDAPKLEALLPSLKDSRNIEEVTMMLLKLAKQRTGKHKSSASFNASSVSYKIGQFCFLVEDKAVLVTKDTKDGGIVNVAFYEYKTKNAALNAAYKMAKNKNQ